jgi:hypothetical protein
MKTAFPRLFIATIALGGQDLEFSDFRTCLVIFDSGVG